MHIIIHLHKVAFYSLHLSVVVFHNHRWKIILSIMYIWQWWKVEYVNIHQLSTATSEHQSTMNMFVVR